MFSKVLFRTLASFSTFDLFQILHHSLSLASSPKGTIENILDNDPRDLIGDFSKVILSRRKESCPGYVIWALGCFLEPPSAFLPPWGDSCNAPKRTQFEVFKDKETDS